MKNLLEAKIIHTFAGDGNVSNTEKNVNDHYLCVLNGDHGYRLFRECDQGDRIEVPQIEDIPAMLDWLDNSGLTISQLIDLVCEYEIWN